MLKIGHRGAKGYCQENTLESFQKALDLGCDGIELDVHLSNDNVLVVIHDDAINRTTTGSGFVSDFTSSELLKLGIPTLEEVVNLVSKKAIINIEIKTEKAIFKVLEFLKKHNSNLHLFQVSSFNWKEPSAQDFTPRKGGDLHWPTPRSTSGPMISMPA